MWRLTVVLLVTGCSSREGLGAAKDLVVSLGYKNGVEVTLHSATCPRLSASAVATLDGVAGEVRERGGKDGAACRPVQLAFPAAAHTSDNTMVLVDGSARVEVQVVRRVPPVLEVGQPCADAGPCDEVYRVGEKVPVRWTPPLEASRVRVTLKNGAPAWRSGQTMPPCTPAGRCPQLMTLLPGELQLEVPRTVLPGPLAVTVNAAFPARDVARCVGAVSCTLGSPPAVVSASREVRVE